jgi:hypothetical protein
MDCFPEDRGECQAADCNESRPYGGGHIHAKQVLGWRREWRGSLCEHFCHGHYNLKNGKWFVFEVMRSMLKCSSRETTESRRNVEGEKGAKKSRRGHKQPNLSVSIGRQVWDEGGEEEVGQMSLWRPTVPDSKRTQSACITVKMTLRLFPKGYLVSKLESPSDW